MNIWWLNHYAVVPELGGGTRHYDIAKQLTSMGHRVKIFVADYHHLIARRWTDLFKKNIVEKDGVEFIVVPVRSYTGNGKDRLLNMLDYSKNAVKIAKQIKEKPDIVIGSSVHPFAWKAAYKISKYYKSRFFIEVRDIWPDDLVKFGLLKKYHPLTIYLYYLERWAYRKAERIISLTPGFLKHLEKLNLNTFKEKVLIIPNGVDLERFEKVVKCDVIDRILEKFEGKITFVYTGAHGPANDLKTVIEGVKILSLSNLSDKIAFIFVGSGPEKKNLIDLSEKLSLKNVEFVDPVPKECIPYLLLKSNALIFSLGKVKIEEPAYSSNKLADYMASGKPVISVDLNGLPLKETNGAIFYTPEDPESFAKAVEKFLNTPKEEIEALGKRNVGYIKENRDIQKLATKLSEIF
jgi:glycosyltransferase involved in cell wall biosynthesis